MIIQKICTPGTSTQLLHQKICCSQPLFDCVYNHGEEFFESYTLHEFPEPCKFIILQSIHIMRLFQIRRNIYITGGDCGETWIHILASFNLYIAWELYNIWPLSHYRKEFLYALVHQLWRKRNFSRKCLIQEQCSQFLASLGSSDFEQ